MGEYKQSARGLFDDIIGHDAVVRFLTAAMDYQTVSHAYLFAGPRGVGKTAVLVRFLKGLIEHGSATSVRTEVALPELDAFLTYPDFTVIRRGMDEKTGKPRKNITVDEVREMRSRLAMGSFLNSWKIAVVDGANDLSTEAANALLKTLEEPTAHTVIVLLASTLAGIPETVASRCQVVRFRLVREATISRGLEARGIKRAEAERSAALSRGRPGLAIRLAEDGDDRTSFDETVREGISLLTSPLHHRFQTIGGMVPEKSGVLEAAGILHPKLDVWEAIIRDALAHSLGLADFAAHHDAEISSWARARTPAQITGVLRRLHDVRRALSENVQPRLAVEQLVLSF